MAGRSMRGAYRGALPELMNDRTVAVLDADLAKTTPSISFARNYPKHFFDMDISEQNLIGTATGVVVSGLRPYTSTFAVFATERAFE